MTEKRALEIPVNHPQLVDEELQLSLTSQVHCLCRNTCTYYLKNVILTSFAVTILLDTVCLTVFAADTDFENMLQ